MVRIKVGFSVPVLQQIDISRYRVGRMTANPHFGTPFPALADVTNAIDALEVAYMDALNKDKEKKRIMRIRRRELKDLIFKLADYVQTESAGNEEIILSSGFDIRKSPTPAPVPETPAEVKVKPAKLAGELEIVLKPVKGARAYIYRMHIGEIGSNPVMLGASLKGSFLARNLGSLTRYYFEVMALNSSGTSGWSDPAMGITL